MRRAGPVRLRSLLRVVLNELARVPDCAHCAHLPHLNDCKRIEFIDEVRRLASMPRWGTYLRGAVRPDHPALRRRARGGGGGET